MEIPLIETLCVAVLSALAVIAIPVGIIQAFTSR